MGLLDFSWIGMFMVLGLSLYLLNTIMEGISMDTGLYHQVILAIGVFFAGFCIYYIYHVIFKRGETVPA